MLTGNIRPNKVLSSDEDVKKKIKILDKIKFIMHNIY